MTLSAAIAGASGYAGGEVIRLLCAHPQIKPTTFTAHSNVGEMVGTVQPHLRSLANQVFTDTTAENLAGHDVVFLALPHGKSGALAWLSAPAEPERPYAPPCWRRKSWVQPAPLQLEAPTATSQKLSRPSPKPHHT